MKILAVTAMLILLAGCATAPDAAPQSAAPQSVPEAPVSAAEPSSESEDEPEPGIVEGGINPTATFDVFSIAIEFSTGVRYDIPGSMYGFGITSSDMRNGVWYRCDEREIPRLREAMWQLRTA